MPGLLEAWLALTSVKYHGNLHVLTPLNQRLRYVGSLWVIPQALPLQFSRARQALSQVSLPCSQAT